MKSTKRNHYIITLIVLACSLMNYQCNAQKKTQPNHNSDTKPSLSKKMKSIDVHSLKQMIDNGDDIQVIDVREEYEYEIGNINGTLIPLGEVIERASEISKDKKVIVHCRSGRRSMLAIQELQEQLGYDNLYNLEGGVVAWAKEIDTTFSLE